MIKPDIIVTWPKNLDFPLWRQFIADNRDKFNLVIVVFMEPNYGPDLSGFVRESMGGGYTLFLDSPPVESGKDWRDVAVNYGLLNSHNAEWVWFTEQDFFPKRQMWDYLHQMTNGTDIEVVGVLDQVRLHPCCIFMKRESLNRTSRDFSANPPAYDHFGAIQNDIESSGMKKRMLPPHTYIHMNGLAHNFKLITEGGLPVYKPEEFYAYLIRSLQVNVPKSPIYTEIVKNYINRVGINGLPHTAPKVK